MECFHWNIHLSLPPTDRTEEIKQNKLKNYVHRKLLKINVMVKREKSEKEKEEEVEQKSSDKTVRKILKK